MDNPNDTDSTVRLLGLFRLSMSTATTLTTRGYWECFFAASQALGDTSTVAEDRLNPIWIRGQGAKTPSRHSYMRRVELQVCPTCLRLDQGRYAEPYLHRAHQLHGTSVCHLHGVMLVSHCHACQRVLVPAREKPALSTRCPCGADLTLSGSAPAEIGALHRLACFEFACLDATPGTLSMSALARTLRDCLLELPPSVGNDRAIRLLRGVFGDVWLQWLLRSSVALASKAQPTAHPIPNRVTLSALHPKVLCAIAVGIGLDFDEVAKLVATRRSVMPKVPEGRAQRRANCALELGVAKDRLEQYLAKVPGARWFTLRRSLPTAFWAVAVLDYEWLDHRVPRRDHVREANRTIPSVRADRELLAALLPDVRRRAALRPRGKEAVLRAIHRDQTWFVSQLDSKRRSEEKRQTDVVVDVLKAARANGMRQTGKPRQITINYLVRETGIPTRVVRHLVIEAKNPNEFIEERSAFFERTVEWAVSRLQLSKASITITRLLAEMQTTSNPRNRVLARKLLANIR